MSEQFHTSDQHLAAARWTAQDDERLRHLASTSSLAELAASFPGRSAAACKQRAARIGVRAQVRPRQGTLTPLLAANAVAAYWVGFIAADGSLSERRLKVQLKPGDVDHLNRLAAWLGPGFSTTCGTRSASLSCQEPEVVSAIRVRFDLQPNKTTSPPRWLPYEDPVLLRSFLCGLIDGDGCIALQTGRRAARLSIVSHLTWLPFLDAVAQRLGFGMVGRRRNGRIDNGVPVEFAELKCHRHNDLVSLRRFAIALDLPVMERKWSRIDLDHIARGGATDRVRVLLGRGLARAQVMDEVGCSRSLVDRTAQMLLAADGSD